MRELEERLPRDAAMRPGMDALLRLLRGDPQTDETSEKEWDAALSLAAEHHLLPWVIDQLLGCSISLELRQRLVGMKREAAIDSFYLTTELKRLMRAFDAEKLAMVPLKGPFLGWRLLGDATLRVSYDLDILVLKQHLERAEDLLLRLGFVPGVADDYHRQWHRGGTTLELHHDVDNPLAFEFSTADVLARLHPSIFEDQACWKLAPEDELHYLCLHAVRHRFERLSILFDLCLAFEKLPISDLGSWATVGERGRLLCLGLTMARRLQPDLCTELKGFPVEVELHMSRVAASLWARLMTGASEVLDWQTLHDFYVEIELPRRRLLRRLRHVGIAAGRLIPPDVEFAARLGFSHRWQAHLLRPVRLLRDRVFANKQLNK